VIFTLPQLDVTRLAADYSAAVRAAHSDLELDAIRNRTAREADPIIDHVHDYTDADDLMAAAISLQLGDSWSWTDLAADIRIAQGRAKSAAYRLSRILVACEWSGTVRDELTARGHSATSCDTLATATPGQHYRGDVRDILADGYHAMVSFPPCTYLTGSQLWRCLPKHDPSGERAALSDKALEFVRDIMAAPIDQQILENPRGRIGSAIRKADIEIHPYMFGDDASKTTGLWCDGIAPPPVPPRDTWIKPRRVMYDGKMRDRWANQSPCGADARGPSATRGHDRGKTYTGIARALADHLTGIIRDYTTPPPASAPAGQLALF
jgi:hypothetical protein